MTCKSCLTSPLAGLLIAFAGCLYILTKWISEDFVKGYDLSEVFQLAGSILFSIGLLLICIFGFGLFTGKVGFLFEKNNGFGHSFGHILYLLIILVMNLSFAIGVGVGLKFLLKNHKTIQIVDKMVNDKLNLSTVNDYVKVSLQSIFCGSCVHFAVKCYHYSFIYCMLFVTVFVYNNFQHCIANSFYFGVMFQQFSVKMLIYLGINIIGNVLGTVPVAMLFNQMITVQVEEESSSSADITRLRYDETSV